MADNKNIVDDYYSQIKQDKDSALDAEKKEKIIPKKIVVKKATIEVLDDKKKEEEKQENPKTSKKEEKKPFIQKIEVVKKEDRIDRINKTERLTNKNENKNSKFEYKFKPKNDNKGFEKKENFQNHKKPVIEFAKKDGFVKKEGSFANAPKKHFSANNNFKNNTKGGNFQKKKNKNFEDENSKKNKFKEVRKTRGKFRFIDEEEITFIRSNKLQKRKKEEKQVKDIKQNLVEKKGETVIIPESLSLKELSEKIGVVLPKLIAEFMKNGMMVNINSRIDFETASIVAEIFDIKLEKDNSLGASVEDIVLGDISSLLVEDDTNKLITRSPVVSIMGHVDHGKTSLLDYIRKSKVAQGEAGGITQSIGAYQVELETGNITFLDTPGHEAFTMMRARGAKSTDIAILVVAADEGVKPQTVESINHAKQADIPVIVAINKMDKVGANPENVKRQLAEQGLISEEWGGNVPMIPVSAHTGFGVDELLEMILLVAEMKELKANPNRNGVATVLESHLDSNFGPVATVLVNTGTVKSGDNIVCEDSYGKVKVLKNYLQEKVKLAKPGEPVLIVGLDKVVEGGAILQVVNNPETAKNKAEEYREILDKQKKAGKSTLELLMNKIKSGNLKQLKIVLKADSNGSLEAIKSAILKLSTPETVVSIIYGGVGAITEGDILMSQGSDTILVGFSVGVLQTAKFILESSDIEFISSDIIYHITERIEKIITGMLDLKEIEIVLGRAKIGGIFFTDKKFVILGLVVPNGAKIELNASARVLRNKSILGTGKIESLKQGPTEVKEVEGPMECGIKFAIGIKVELGDELEVFKIEKQK